MSFKSALNLVIGDTLSKVVAGIAIAILSTIGVLLGGLLIKFRKDWKYIKTLRKVHKSSESSCCKCYMLCGLFLIIFGHSCCQCCKVSDDCKTKPKENGKNKTTTEKWENLSNNEVIQITQSDLNRMKKRYVNHCYSHKYYCFRKQGERCPHYKTTKWKKLIQHPVLYLLTLNFAEAKKNVDLEEWQKNEMYPLEFIFKEGFQDKYKKLKAFKDIEKDLANKTENICLVIKNLPSGNYEDFEDEEKSLAKMILNLHSFHDVPLMYNVR